MLQNMTKNENPVLFVDNVIFGFDPKDKQLKILIMKRSESKYSLVGGRVKSDENAKTAAIRETFAETSVKIDNNRQMWQIGAFTEPGRDSRYWSLTIAHSTFLYPFVPQNELRNENAQWLTIKNDGKITFENGNQIVNLSDLEFDHKDIIETTFARIRASLNFSPDIVRTLGNEFSIRQALDIYSIFDEKYRQMTTSNFVKIFVKSRQIFRDTGKSQKQRTAVGGRPQKLIALNED